MTIARSMIASYASQIAITAISIGAIPLYLRYMGLEAYGLVGVFMTLQAWFAILDLGLSPTMLRETARYRAGTANAEFFGGLLRAMEIVFFSGGVAITAIVAFGANRIAVDWLNVRQLSVNDVAIAVMLMAPSLGLRLVAALYRNTINGLGQIVWMSGLNLAAAVARFGLVIPYLMFVSRSPIGFFTFQLVVSVVETAFLVSRTYRSTPSARTRASWSALRNVGRFSAAIAFSGAIWSVVNQSDKLILSKVLPLHDYAVFTLAAVAAGGVVIMSTPAGPALIPRLTALSAADDPADLAFFYRRATRLIALLAGTAAIALALFAEPLVWAWTGQRALAVAATPVLILYALGNAVVAIASLPNYLQFAIGRLRLHVIGQTLMLFTMVPLIIVAAYHSGMIGAGRVWLGVNLAYLLLYVPVIHHRLLPGIHIKWLLHDITLTVLPGAIVGFVCANLITWPDSRLLTGLLIGITGCTMLTVGCLCQRWARDWIAGFLRHTLHKIRLGRFALFTRF